MPVERYWKDERSPERRHSPILKLFPEVKGRFSMQLKDADRDYADLLYVRMLSGDPAGEEQARVELEIWAKGKPDRLAYIASLTKAEAVLNALPRLPLPKRPRAVLRSTRQVAWLAAASLAFAATCIWIVNPELSSQTYATNVGEQKNIVLKDGSTASLNTGTRLSFTERLRSREVNLITGEALFDVQHSPIRPFTVAAEKTRVKVVGTSFSVRNRESGSRIEVVRGLVEVSPADDTASRLLRAGEAVETARGAFSSDIEPVDVASVSQWRDGRVTFDGVPLSSMIEELRRYRLAPIQLLDPKLGTLQFTGSFSTTQPDLVLKLLPSLYKVRVVLDADGTARISRK